MAAEATDGLAGHPAASARRAASRLASAYGLVAAILALPAYLAVHDVIHDGNLTRLAGTILAGVGNGAIWTLVALGYTMIYATLGLINFAHGDVFTIGSLTSLTLIGSLGLIGAGTLGVIAGLVLVLVVAMAASALMNGLIEQVGFKPLRNAPKLAPLITGIGLAFVLENAALLWIGGAPTEVPDLIGAQETLMTVAGVNVTQGVAFAVAASTPLIGGLIWLMTRSSLGRAMRATAQDPMAARLMGIPVERIIAIVFALTGALAGAAGLIYALFQTSVSFQQGFQAGLIGFTAAVLGGIGNVRGAVVGGLTIGILQQLADNRIGAQWTPAVVFAFLIVVLVFRPSGLLGQQIRDAG